MYALRGASKVRNGTIYSNDGSSSRFCRKHPFSIQFKSFPNSFPSNCHFRRIFNLITTRTIRSWKTPSFDARPPTDTPTRWIRPRRPLHTHTHTHTPSVNSLKIDEGGWPGADFSDRQSILNTCLFYKNIFKI
jgi:hypothetical protein